MNRAISDYPPHASPDDRALFDRARSEHARALQYDVGSFATYVSTLDLRTQTALICDAVRRDPRNHSFIRTVELPDLLPAATPAPTLLIVPGAFYQQHRHTGADGLRLIKLAEDMGWPHERVEIESFGRLERNADILTAHLKRMSAESIVIVSLSKGSAEVARALEHLEAAEMFRRVRGWVSLSGLVFGTPLIDWLRARRLRAAGVRLLLWARGQQFAVLDQLRHSSTPIATNGRPLPKHLRSVQVLGFPLPEHLQHRWAHRAYRRLASLGANDGGGNLLIDALRWPGELYPLWAADHYLNPTWNAAPTLQRILRYASRTSLDATDAPQRPGSM